MIQTGNSELDQIITALTDQRNSALDNLAVMSGKLSAQESLAKDLKKQLDDLLKKEDK
jgi:hypothetical protein